MILRLFLTGLALHAFDDVCLFFLCLLLITKSEDSIPRRASPCSRREGCFPAGPAKVLRVHSGCYDAIACAGGNRDSGNTDHSQALNTDCTGCTLNKNVQLGVGAG